VYAIAGATIGAAGHVILPPLAEPDQAFATIVNAVLPAGMRGLLLAAALAAIMSTCSACLLASSTVLIEDVYFPLRGSASIGSINLTRVITLLLGISATIAACLTSDVIAALTVAYDLLAGALFVPVIGAILWKRGTSLAALTSIAVSGMAVVVTLFEKGMDSDAPIYVGLGLSLVIFVSMSFMDKARTS
jgi:solute:Na+ symporter, SSS family